MLLGTDYNMSFTEQDLGTTQLLVGGFYIIILTFNKAAFEIYLNHLAIKNTTMLTCEDTFRSTIEIASYIKLGIQHQVEY